MNIIDIIERKKLGEELSREEIAYFVNGVTDESIPDYQVSALLMAICLRGMTDEETYILADEMTHSGDVMDLGRYFPSENRPVILDKHSTGGVGDKTTLIIGPILAAMDIPIGKMSGRGLGITGGTIDKLESIPGFNSELSEEQFAEALIRVGLVDAAQTRRLAPADKRLYALRDVTGTVNCIPLIASSIMSKKLASGADAIVLDVKCGSGAFMKDESEARHLGAVMLEIARSAGKGCAAVISDMNEPLGRAVGNIVEVKEAADYLTGRCQDARLKTLVEELSRELYILNASARGEAVLPDEEILSNIEDAVISGRAYSKFTEFVVNQGGDIDYIEALRAAVDYSEIPGMQKVGRRIIKAERAGILGLIDAELIGRCSLMLGAGRETKSDDIDSYAGVVFDRKSGDTVSEGDVICTIYASDQNRLDEAEKILGHYLNGVIGEEGIHNDIILAVMTI